MVLALSMAKSPRREVGYASLRPTPSGAFRHEHGMGVSRQVDRVLPDVRLAGRDQQNPESRIHATGCASSWACYFEPGPGGSFELADFFSAGFTSSKLNCLSSLS